MTLMKSRRRTQPIPQGKYGLKSLADWKLAVRSVALSALGQKQTCAPQKAVQLGMSAKCQ